MITPSLLRRRFNIHVVASTNCIERFPTVYVVFNEGKLRRLNIAPIHSGFNQSDNAFLPIVASNGTL